MIKLTRQQLWNRLVVSTAAIPLAASLALKPEGVTRAFDDAARAADIAACHMQLNRGIQDMQPDKFGPEESGDKLLNSRTVRVIGSTLWGVLEGGASSFYDEHNKAGLYTHTFALPVNMAAGALGGAWNAATNTKYDDAIALATRYAQLPRKARPDFCIKDTDPLSPRTPLDAKQLPLPLTIHQG